MATETAETRAAIERLRKERDLCVEHKWGACWVLLSDVESILEMFRDDDAEPVTQKWWDDKAGLAEEFADCPEWLTRRMMHGARGDVRLVCAGLGIKLRCDGPALTETEREVLIRNAASATS